MDSNISLLGEMSWQVEFNKARSKAANTQKKLDEKPSSN